MDDKNSMVYTQAVILETHRWAMVAISIGPRQSVKDLEYNGRTIKKGTTIVGNLYPVFQVKEYWGDPNVFRPERFIGEEGDLIKTERIIPFGCGKRVCFGEVLAKESAFVYLTALMQRYKFTLPEDYGENRPSLKLIEGITTCPHDYRVKMTRRME